MKDLIAPTVHLNGTPRDRLVDQMCDAVHALQLALDAMTEASPNGRDYYPQGDQALRRAETEHRDRIERVRSVMAEYLALSEEIAG